MGHGIHTQLSVRYSAKKMKSSVQEVQVYLIPASHLILRPPVPRFVLLRATQKIKSIAQGGLTLKLVANGKVIANIMSLLLFVNITVQCNALLENIHAGWDMMTLVVLCQGYAPMEVYVMDKMDKDFHIITKKTKDL